MAKSRLSGYTWILQSWTVGGKPQVWLLDHKITLAFNDLAQPHQLSGSTGGNRYVAIYSAAGERLQMTHIGETLARVLPQELESQELRYMSAFRQITRYRLDEGILTLQDDSGDIILRYG